MLTTGLTDFFQLRLPFHRFFAHDDFTMDLNYKLLSFRKGLQGPARTALSYPLQKIK